MLATGSCPSPPSCTTICHALTWKNARRFFMSPHCAAFVFFVLGLYANSVLQVVADRETVKCGDLMICPPSSDLGHQAFPHLTFVSICDYWLYVSVILTFIRFSPICITTSLSLVMFRRWMFLQGCMFWMRGISVALTRQSVPQEGCVSTATGNPWVEGFYIMTGIHRTCGDIMYSGHTAGLTLLTLIWTHYSKGEEFSVCCGEHRPFITPDVDAVGDPATCSLTSVIAWGIAFTGFFFIIATHFHYSNDVFIGCILTQFVFRVYHYYIKSLLELPGLWAKGFRWFEGFDLSLREQLSPHHQHGLLHTHSPAPSPDRLEPFKAEARLHVAGLPNKDEAVAPLSGVAVAVFSEGPAAEKRNEREREQARKRRSSGGDGGDKYADEKKTESSPAPIVALTTPTTQWHAPILPAEVARPSTPHSSGPLEYDYEAMECGACDAEADEAAHRRQPVVVAGEIATHEREIRSQERNNRTPSPRPAPPSKPPSPRNNS